jgi:hypothetical protein
VLGHQALALGADRAVGVVVDLAALDDGYLFIEQVDKGACEAGLGLPALAQEDDILAGKDGILYLRDNGVP